MDYVVKGKMIGGFALVAYPAEYGVSGIKTFIVNHRGVVYEKRSGPHHGHARPPDDRFNPDKTWQKVQASNCRFGCVSKTGAAARDPRACNAHSGSVNRIGQSKNRLPPCMVGLDQGDDHKDGGSDPRNDGVAGPADDRYRRRAHPDQNHDAPAAGRKDPQVNLTENEAGRRSCQA